MKKRDKLTRAISKVVRASVKMSGHPCPIRLVDGFSAPEVRGRSYYWTTPGGRPVYHPSAYMRNFGRPIYHASSLRIVVGIGWLIEKGVIQ